MPRWSRVDRATTECSFNASTSSVSRAGNTMVVDFCVTFAPTYVGRHGLRLKAKDDSGLYTVFTKRGFVIVDAYARSGTSPR